MNNKRKVYLKLAFIAINEKINSIFISKKEKSYHKDIIKNHGGFMKEENQKELTSYSKFIKKYVF